MSVTEERAAVDWTEYPSEVVPIDRLRPNPSNPWEHGARQEEAVSESLDDLGLLQLPVWNRTTGHLVDGHLRWQLAVKDGAQELRCRVVEWPEEKERRALTIINQTARLVETNDRLLAQLLEEQADGAAGLPAAWDEGELYALLERTAPNGPLPVAGASTGRLGSVSGDAEEEDYDLPNIPTSHVRMVQLFLDVETQPEFMERCQRLGKSWGTETVTDTVLAVIRHADDPDTYSLPRE